MATDREFLERFDRHNDQMDRSLDRIDEHVARGNELMERIEGEFQLNREVQNHVLAESWAYRDDASESHEAVMKRLDDLGVHMREQTEALIRINEKL